MKMNSEVNRETFIAIYRENRDLLVPILAALASVFLFVLFIIPELTSVPQKTIEKNSEVAKLNKLKSSTSLASGTNTELLDSQIETASLALPPSKDFESIFNAITSAAKLSNVSLSTYQLTSGDDTGKYPTLKFDLTMSAGPTEVVNFINQLYKTSPVSEVTSIETAGTDARVSIVFYYKPYPPVGFEDRVGIREMSEKEKSTYDEILSWNPGGLGIIEPVTATSSAEESSSSSSSPF